MNHEYVRAIRLVGTRGSRRTEFFEKAAGGCAGRYRFEEWEALAERLSGTDIPDWRGSVVKIDPPSWKTVCLEEMFPQIQQYSTLLRQMEQTGCEFLNSPRDILQVLDKSGCKRRLEEAGVCTTQLLAERVGSREELWRLMDFYRTGGVFLKPVFGSGAAGVAAYRRMRAGAGSGEREVLYTSCYLEHGRLINTKKLFRLEETEQIRLLLEGLFRLGVMVERWTPKAVFRGRAFDLRVVWQFGRVAFVVARQSKGPITNLHLNNGAFDWRTLGLSQETLDGIEMLCARSMELFPGLNMAGFDILLEKYTGRPCVIEINGQGDLMYQDIFDENRIYKEQMTWMSEKTT